MAKETVIGSFIQKILFAVDESSVDNAKSAIDGIKSFAANALGAIGIGFSLTQVASLAEEFRTVNDAIRSATLEMENQDEIQQKILQGAKDCREEYGVMAGSVSRLIQQNRELFPVDDAIRFVSIIEKIEKTSGKGADVDQTMDVLKQVTAAGVMERGVFDQLREDAPEIINAITSGLGITVSQMQAMTDAGTLSAQQIKDALFSVEEEVNRRFGDVAYSIKDSLVKVRNEWGLFVADVDETFGLTERFGKTIRDISGFVLDKAQKGIGLLKSLSERLGGMDQLLKLILISAAAVFAATNGTQLLTFLGSALKFLRNINIQTALAAAKWLLLFLVLEDVFTFLSGGDSVIGRLLSDAGVDVDALRESVLSFFSSAKELGRDALEALKGFWGEHGDEVTAVLQNLLSIAGNVVALLVTLAGGAFSLLNGLLVGFQTGDWTTFLSALSDLWSNFLNVLDSLGQAIFGDLWDPLKESAQAVWDWIKGFFDWFGEKINWAKDLWNGVKDFFTGGDDESGSPSGAGRSDVLGAASGGLPVSSTEVASGAGRVTNNRNVNVTQENNQQYTFQVTEREAADRLRTTVDQQETQSSDDLARALGYGR